MEKAGAKCVDVGFVTFVAKVLSSALDGEIYDGSPSTRFCA